MNGFGGPKTPTRGTARVANTWVMDKKTFVVYSNYGPIIYQNCTGNAVISFDR